MEDEELRGSVSLSSDVLVQQLPDGEAIFLNLSTEEYFGLDVVGTSMYAALIESSSVGDAYARVRDEFAVDPEVLRRDLLALLDKLVARRLVDYRDPRTPSSP